MRPSGSASVTVNGPGSAAVPELVTVISHVAVEPDRLSSFLTRDTSAAVEVGTIAVLAFEAGWPVMLSPCTVAVLSMLPRATSVSVTV